MKEKFRLKMKDKSIDLNDFKNDALKQGVTTALKGGFRPWMDSWGDSWAESWAESPNILK